MNMQLHLHARHRLLSLGAWAEFLSQRLDEAPHSPLGWVMALQNAIAENSLPTPRFDNGMPWPARKSIREHMDICWLKSEDVGKWLEGFGYRIIYLGDAPAEKVSTPRPKRLDAALRQVVADAVRPTKTKNRDSLDAAIDHAKTLCKNPEDTAEMYVRMQTLAVEKYPPLLAATAKGLRYRKEDASDDGYLTKSALNKRLHPEKRGSR